MINNKNIKCVELQRSVRDNFWIEAKGNLDALDKIIDNELAHSKLYQVLKTKVATIDNQLTRV